jgi:hypothetical protein
MSVYTQVKEGLIHKMDVETTILDIPKTKGNFNHNPSIARDSKGHIWLSLRSNTVQVKKNFGLISDNNPKQNHYTNQLYVGKLNEDTLAVTGLKEITPVDKKYFQWGIEDVRIFWRKDGLHGIGVIVNTSSGKHKVSQGEILINYAKGTYTLIKDHGQPFGHTEKNWGPTVDENPHFDFAYSPTEVVVGNKVIGEPYDGSIHGGTQLLPYKDGYLAIAHIVTSVKGQKHYISQALLRDKYGVTKEMSQTWHLDVGWREHLKESVEFISGAVWSKGKEGSELLVVLGVKDVLCGAARIPVDKLKLEPVQDFAYYNISFTEPPTRDGEPLESLISSGKVKI